MQDIHGRVNYIAVSNKYGLIFAVSHTGILQLYIKPKLLQKITRKFSASDVNSKCNNKQVPVGFDAVLWNAKAWGQKSYHLVWFFHANWFFVCVKCDVLQILKLEEYD